MVIKIRRQTTTNRGDEDVLYYYAEVAWELNERTMLKIKERR